VAEDRTTLPLPDYDHLPVGTLQHRIRSLDAVQLETVSRYEREHAARAPVLTVIDERLAQLEAGAQPSAGNQDVRPEAAPPPSAGGGDPGERSSPVSPPPHGNPAQPAKPKGDAQGP
jgi:hypothetical protein